jgi:GDP-L-fucose synthase
MTLSPDRTPPEQFWRGKRVLVTGSAGFIGGNLVPKLQEFGANVIAPTRADYDLLEQDQVRRLFAQVKPEVTFHLAAMVGGIVANKKYPADFCYRNLLMNTCMFHEAFLAGVRKYVTFVGGCSYPSNAPSPIPETEFWNGYPQPESASYALAKRMEVVMGRAYREQHGFDAITLLPGNVYGPRDNFKPESAHVIPATIRRFVEATGRGDSVVTVWGSGRPVRDFVYIDDVCDVVLREVPRYSSSDLMNISSGVATTIRELVESVAGLCGYQGRIEWDTSKPDGQQHKVFDVTRLREREPGFTPTPLREGLRRTIEWFRTEYATARL